MIGKSIEPLRKKNLAGVTYTRLPDIEDKLAELHVISAEEVAMRCCEEDSGNRNYVPSECLLALLRDYRSRALDELAGTIFKSLIARVLKGLPEPESLSGEDLNRGNIRDEARYRFIEMIVRDRQAEYVENLDFFEVRFAKALKFLRRDAERKIRNQGSFQPLEINDETGDFSPEVEKATAILDPQFLEESENRGLLNAAIRELPEFEKAIVVMTLQGIPIESKEPGIANISNLLRKTPKTIAKYRDIACTKLQSLLKRGEPV